MVEFFKMIDKNLTLNMSEEMNVTILDFDEEEYEYKIEHEETQKKENREIKLSSFELNFTFTKTLYNKMLQITFHNNSKIVDIYGIPLSNYTMEILMANVEVPSSL